MSSVNFAQPDVTLRLDLAGVIRGASLSNALSGEATTGWIGRVWADTVAGGGNAQVRQMLDDALSTGLSPFHQVRQRLPSGMELAVEYTTVRLEGTAGLIAIGRSLEAVTELRSRLVAAQLSMERDYWKLREVETRYRLLFDASAQPVLLVSADDMRIVEANPAAIRALGVGRDCDLLPEVLPAQREAFDAMLARVREQGKAPGLVAHLGPDRQPWLVRASLVAAEPGAVYILQLSPSSAPPYPVDRGSRGRLEEVMARLPHGFVVLDAEGTILQANRAFLELVEHTTEGSVLGQRLGRWLLEPGAEAGVALDDARRIHAARQFTATIVGELGRETAVEISTAGNTDSAPRFLGVLLHRLRDGGAAAAPAPADLPGTGTLREIVQATVATVERRCIEAALDGAKGNRTVAAKRLGLSRQSLYAKLVRYASEVSTTVPRRKK